MAKFKAIFVENQQETSVEVDSLEKGFFILENKDYPLHVVDLEKQSIYTMDYPKMKKKEKLNQAILWLGLIILLTIQVIMLFRQN